jgi:hypothetical protein
MAWGITKDHIAEPGEKSAVGLHEEHARIPVIAVALGHESPELPPQPDEKLKVIDFQMFDDDGELYYEGRLHDDEGCENQSAALTWGEGNAGCTMIRVNRQDGRGWVQEIG